MTEEHEKSGVLPTQERIADAAIRVIARRGFDVVSMRSVAQESGLSAGTVQYHYTTRQDLLVAALTRSVERQVQRVERARGPGGYRASLVRALRELLPLEGVRREDAAVWVSYGAAASTRTWLAELYWAEMQHFHAMVRDVLERARQDGKLREGLTPDAAASLVTALVNGLTLDHLNAPDPVRAGVEAALDRGLHLIVTD
ncbi:TetR/AcrR family transcriptional regulator [Kocuria tytonis]|uniref:TetR family transcriptional regulator n=1 Tax=Kocuria tytonis TaxID=2054280 RepID=A0A495A9Z6_9MICC|nr:TetR/AcrR family transcriptional regulator [Kocuria tytonis]RKQ36828.1 TetR family transcriptional regulator [Kocuria tytonis]